MISLSCCISLIIKRIASAFSLLLRLRQQGQNSGKRTGNRLASSLILIHISVLGAVEGNCCFPSAALKNVKMPLFGQKQRS